jgi:hypothetical protein
MDDKSHGGWDGMEPIGYAWVCSTLGVRPPKTNLARPGCRAGQVPSPRQPTMKCARTSGVAERSFPCFDQRSASHPPRHRHGCRQSCAPGGPGRLDTERACSNPRATHPSFPTSEKLHSERLAITRLLYPNRYPAWAARRSSRYRARGFQKCIAAKSPAAPLPKLAAC